MWRPAFFRVPLARGAAGGRVFPPNTARRAAAAAARPPRPPTARNERAWLIVAAIMLSAVRARTENKETAAGATHMRVWRVRLALPATGRPGR